MGWPVSRYLLEYETRYGLRVSRPGDDRRALERVIQAETAEGSTGFVLYTRNQSGAWVDVTHPRPSEMKAERWGDGVRRFLAAWRRGIGDRQERENDE